MKTTKKPLDCRSARDLMFDYIDGSLNDSDAAALEAHLSECEPCRTELSERQKMLELVALSGTALPQSFADNILAKIENIPREKRALFPSSRLISIASIAACAVILLAVGFRGMIFSDIVGADRPSDDSDSATHTTRISSETFSTPRVYGNYTATESPTKLLPQASQSPVPGSPEAHLADTANTPTFAFHAAKSTVNSVFITRGKATNEIVNVYEKYSAVNLNENNAFIVGYSSQFRAILGETPLTKMRIDGKSYDCHTITESCLKFASQILTNETVKELTYRAYIPAETEISKLIVILIPD